MDSEFKLPVGLRELKIGDSLKTNNTSFHGIKYDFKPSNEEYDESAMMEITPTNQVTLKYTPTNNEGTSDFMYSGTMKPFPKEYFLIIDHVTGEVTLERLTANVQLKRTKVTNKSKYQNNKKPQTNKECSPSPELRVNDMPSTSQKKTKRKQKTKGSPKNEPKPVTKKYGLIPQHSPLHPSPSRNSPTGLKNPTTSDVCKLQESRNLPETSNSQPSLLSLDDDESSMTGFESKFAINLPELTNIPQQENEFGLSAIQDTIGYISESSSDSSSDSDSDSDSESSSSSSSSVPENESQTRVNGYSNGCLSPTLIKGQLLKEDLQLSETGSDSD